MDQPGFLCWRLAPRMWSVRIKAIATAVQGSFIFWPSFALSMWNSLPVQMTSHLPARTVFVLPLALFIASIPAQFVQQKNLNAGR
jgi:hypothetical protein